MKVKEVIKYYGWSTESGFSLIDTYSSSITDIEELPKTADDYDWSWFHVPAENPEDYGRDLKIVVEFYSVDPPSIKPLVRFSKWHSDLWHEKYGKG